jgi:tryptophan synthase alpha chain
MNRIKSKFEELRNAGRKALIPYITPEFPVKGVTVPLMQALEQSGADFMEIGIPFSDPLADGKTIQHASDVALRNGVHIPLILTWVRQFRTSSQLPLLLMGYINPILRYGVKKFLADCVEAGVDGLIVPDLPPEEAGELIRESAAAKVSLVFLIAPTTTAERIQKIDELSTDFSYCVSVTGVTGARPELGMNGSFDAFLQRVKQHAKKPFVVGFGISSAEHVRRVWQFSDGAVVGSALLQSIQTATSVDETIQRASKFLSSLLPSS